MEKVGWQVYYQWAEKIARRDDSWGQAACFFSEQSLFLQGVPVLWESSAADPPQRWTAPDCLIFNAYWTYWLWLLQFSLLITILGVLAEVSSGLRTAGAMKLHIDIDRSYSRAACFKASEQFCACLIYFYIKKKKKVWFYHCIKEHQRPSSWTKAVGADGPSSTVGSAGAPCSNPVRKGHCWSKPNQKQTRS